MFKINLLLLRQNYTPALLLKFKFSKKISFDVYFNLQKPQKFGLDKEFTLKKSMSSLANFNNSLTFIPADIDEYNIIIPKETKLIHMPPEKGKPIFPLFPIDSINIRESSNSKSLHTNNLKISPFFNFYESPRNKLEISNKIEVFHYY